MDKEFEWRTGRSCIFKNFYHLVFVTKYRRTALTSDMLKRLEEIFKETMQQMDGEPLEFGGEGDHVHMMISSHPKNAMSAVVSKLKGKSSYLLRREFWADIKKKLWGKHFWSPSYCIVSCGGAPLEIVRAYIENQQRPEDPKHIAQSKRLTGVKRKLEIHQEPARR